MVTSRDVLTRRRNVATHFIGIPMIAVAVAALLARVPLFEVAGVSVSLAWLATLATVAFYLRLELRFGAVMGALMRLNLWAGTAINDTSSVVAAGYSYSKAAGDFATIVKLTRATLIIPVCLVLALAVAASERRKLQASGSGGQLVA